MILTQSGGRGDDTAQKGNLVTDRVMTLPKRET